MVQKRQHTLVMAIRGHSEAVPKMDDVACRMGNGSHNHGNQKGRQRQRQDNLKQDAVAFHFSILPALKAATLLDGFADQIKVCIVTRQKSIVRNIPDDLYVLRCQHDIPDCLQYLQI